MIKITLPTKVPAILLGRGASSHSEMCKNYKAGARQFEFDRTIYASQSVKRALATAQHGKCAYCEGKFQQFSHGDIDHFRPKARVRQHETSQEQSPGYYWLAYSMGNLLFCCERCNRTWKKTYFPLQNPAARARCHDDDLDAESPLLIDPRKLDPREHIRFRDEYPYAFNGSLLGETSIKILGLDRETLNEARRAHLRRVWALWVITNAQPPIPERVEAEQLLTELQSGSSEFSGATRDYLAELNK